MIHNTCNFIGSNEVTAVFPFIKFEITDQQKPSLNLEHESIKVLKS